MGRLYNPTPTAGAGRLYSAQPQEQAQKPGFFQSALQELANPFLKLARVPIGLVESGIGALTGSEADKKRGAELLSRRPADFGFLGKVNQAGYDENGNKLSDLETIKEAAGTGLELGTYFIGGGEAKAGLQAVKSGTTKIVKPALESGLIGGAGSVGHELQNPDATPESVAAAGTAGTLFGTILGAGVPAVIKTVAGTASKIKRVVSPEVEDALTRAIKPAKNNVGFSHDLNLALPEISDTLTLKGVNPKEMTINDLSGALLDTKKRIWDRYESIMSPNAHVQIDTSPIADSIESTITPRFEMQNPGKADQIRKIADHYRNRRMTVGDAEQFLQEANAELHSYYAKNKVGRAVAATDPEISAVLHEADGLRAELYGKLNSLTDEADPNASELKKLWGALTNIGNEVDGRAQVFNRQNPATLQETIHYPWAVAKGIGSLIRGDVMGAGESLAQIGLSRAMKEANSSEGLIRGAFTKLQKSAIK